MLSKSMLRVSQERNEEIILWLDCVDETLKYFHRHEKAKEESTESY